MALLNIKTNKKLLALSAAIAFSTFATNSYALEVTTTSTYTAGSGTNATTASNTQTVNTDTSTATSIVSSSSGYSNNIDSFGSAETLGTIDGSFVARAQGSGVAYSASSSILYSQSFTTTSAQNFALNFEILRGQLDVYGTPTTATDFADAGYDIFINLQRNGTTTSLFNSSAILSLNSTGQITFAGAGESLNPSYDINNPSSFYSWNDYTRYASNESLTIGSFAANESFSIEYGMRATASGQFTNGSVGFSNAECGGGCNGNGSGVSTGDPFSIFGSGTGLVVTSTPATPSSVPEASSILLMGLGLVGLAFGRRKA